MKVDSLKIDTKNQFGTYQLSPRQKAAVSLIRKTTSKPAINFLRQIGGLRHCKIADIKVYGGQMRVYPGLNRSDKVMLGMPHVFDAPERRALAEHLRKTPNPSFIDIGANIGAYSLFVNSLNLGTKMVAIEADPEIFARMNFNLPDHIQKLNLAVASEEGELPFYIDNHNRGENSLITKSADRLQEKIVVPAKRLSQILDAQGIDKPTAFKIDVEGAEMDILAKFYDESPVGRWPELIIVEHIHCKPVIEMLFSKGYKEVLRTKLNMVLTKRD